MRKFGDDCFFSVILSGAPVRFGPGLTVRGLIGHRNFFASAQEQHRNGLIYYVAFNCQIKAAYYDLQVTQGTRTSLRRQEKYW
ncbi:hypothetical protein E4U31_005230 [Claviceps sp. LM219 group G6]|nr:hypothetical protein E4U31_005230 [Claviceps sp. LM219 group G6]